MLLDRLGREAHLWIVKPEAIADSEVLAACMQSLSDQEQQRYRRFRFPQDRQLYLVSHALVRGVLSKYAEIAPCAWCFSQGDRGKPKVAIPGLSAIRFNLSHTRGLAVCLVTSGCECGVDVEMIRARRNPIGVAKRMFSESEVKEMQRLQGREQLEYFFCRWTLREAYTKARGVGITFPVHKLKFKIVSAAEVDVEFQADINDKRENWQFDIFRVTDEHVVAVAICGPGQANKTIVKYHMLDDMHSYDIGR